MPFRVLFNYTADATVVGRDPSRKELELYIAWLDAELARAWFALNQMPPEPKKET